MADLEEIEVVHAMQFPKVTVRDGDEQHAGRLTILSCKLILVEFERQGFRLVRACT